MYDIFKGIKIKTAGSDMPKSHFVAFITINNENSPKLWFDLLVQRMMDSQRTDLMLQVVRLCRTPHHRLVDDYSEWSEWLTLQQRAKWEQNSQLTLWLLSCPRYAVGLVFVMVKVFIDHVIVSQNLPPPSAGLRWCFPLYLLTGLSGVLNMSSKVDRN